MSRYPSVASPFARCALTALLTCTASTPRVASAQGARSVGAPDRGRLVDGVPMEPGEGLALLASPGVQWGTEELVGLIRRSALRLARDEPGAAILVGSLSRRRGGRLPPHDSHQSGRDVDLGFFMTDEEGEPVATPSFVELAPGSGCGRTEGRSYCIDPRRTFELVVALLQDEEVRVRWILMASDLRQLVLASGRRLDVPVDLMRRVEEATVPRDGSASHRSHIHVRIECPDDDLPRCQG